jgi:glycosyltransferase involved in cell wall biosynthesis
MSRREAVRRTRLGRVLRQARVTARDVARTARDARRWAAIARAPRPAEGAPRVFYGRDRIPARSEPAHGGTVKFQALQDEFPNEPRGFDVLYLGSSTLPADSRTLIWLARRRGAGVVWNQDGVAYRGWYGDGFENVNRPFARALHEADHVFFQSEFCKLSADRFLGKREGPWEILYNPVDVERFTPAPTERARDLTVLLGGNQYQRYRFESAARAFAIVARERGDARLLVSGRLSWTQADDPPEAERTARRLVEELGIAGRVEFVGAYVQDDAPTLMRRADLLLHTKYNDPCPGVVLEAMASGLPVVYSASGGVPELVGADAGIGIDAPFDFEQDHPPDPEALAAAVLTVAQRLDDFGEAARRRAVERFDVRAWVQRHRELFGELSDR